MTLPIMMNNQKTSVARAGFTLIELGVVLGLIATVAALAAPSLTRSSRLQTIKREAGRMVGLTELAKRQALSHAVPMIVWVLPEKNQYGMMPAGSYAVLIGDERSFTLADGIRMELEGGQGTGEFIELARFLPDASLEQGYIQVITLEDEHGNARVLQCEDGQNYEVSREMFL
ncbi:prepilin-type N-terminal cleavage/methylation domain-containing protein [Kiritimatiellaeota bacterium B1221]|nr:prepilin-type N-terminal cleavage/methylation domain-containing protein [Kiritimatiellaeota bacterium B1221]